MKALFFPLVLFAALLPAQEIDAEHSFPAELMLRAYSHCYPEKTGSVIFQNNDWTIKSGGETYYWAGGRLLPANIRDKADMYSPLAFEFYPDAIPLPEIYSPRYIEALRAYGETESAHGGDDQHWGFHGAIFGGAGRVEIESCLEKIIFLGKQISVHHDIAAALGRVDAAVRQEAAAASARGKETAAFIASIGQTGGYNWREIRSGGRRSYHSWGLAVDIQPKQTKGKAVYWLWERARSKDWMRIPLKNRWMPPAAVIEAFEREGFVWGGKWALYDTMHFEYRPELHELKRLLAARGDTFSGGALRTSSQDLHHLYPGGLGR